MMWVILRELDIGLRNRLTGAKGMPLTGIFGD
jgi:hypothetical protein